MEEEIEVVGQLNLPEETTSQTEQPAQGTKKNVQTVEAQVYTGKLLQTDDTNNFQLIFFGLLLCCIVLVSYQLKKLNQR